VPLEIGHLELAELGTVARLFHSVWHETQAPLQHAAIATTRDIRFFQNRLEQRAPRTLVARTNGDIVGFACWSPGFLNSLFVARGMRRTGAGAGLCDAAETAIRTHGAEQMGLDCVKDNWPARHFYERRGWRLAFLHDDDDVRPEGIPATKLWRLVK
jgi:GNAT superfamily N-acetyltransferase